MGMYCSAEPCDTRGGNGSDLMYVGHGGEYTARRRNMCWLLIFPALACLLLTLGLLCYLLWPTNECLDHKDTFQYHWSKDKTMRCGAKGYVSCPPVVQPPVVQPARGPVDPSNCADGEANWP